MTISYKVVWPRNVISVVVVVVGVVVVVVPVLLVAVVGCLDQECYLSSAFSSSILSSYILCGRSRRRKNSRSSR